MDHTLSFTPLGHQIATALMIASPLVISAFWLGTMLRRSVSIREWLGLVLLWAVALPVLKLCFLTSSYYQLGTYPATYYAPAPVTGMYSAPYTTTVPQPAVPPPATPPPTRAPYGTSSEDPPAENASSPDTK